MGYVSFHSLKAVVIAEVANQFIFSSLIISGNFYSIDYHFQFRRAALDARDSHHVSTLVDSDRIPQCTSSIRSISCDRAFQDTSEKVPTID